MRSRDECLRLFQQHRKLAYAGLREASQMSVDPLRYGCDMGDLETAAMLGLWDACRFYNASRGAFATYAYRAVVRRVHRAMSEGARDCRWVSLDAFLGEARSDRMAEKLVDPGPSPWESAALAMDVERVHQLLMRLPRRTARATVLWSLGWPPSEIGRELGISRQRAHQLPREGTAQLRRLAASVGEQEF